MLSSFYKLADLDLEEPVKIWENRGRTAVELDRSLYTQVGVDGLNTTHMDLLGSGKWFQLWRGEIVSVNSPEAPPTPAPRPIAGRCSQTPVVPKGAPRLIVQHVLTDLLGSESVKLMHGRGRATFLMSRRCFTPEGLACDAIGALNAAAQAILRGGQWIQVWDGEIITMYDDGPEAKGDVA